MSQQFWVTASDIDSDLSMESKRALPNNKQKQSDEYSIKALSAELAHVDFRNSVQIW